MLMLASIVDAAASDTPGETSIVDPFRMLDWKGFNQVSTLSDGTSLYRYVAQSSISSASPAETDTPVDASVNIRISFLPRFQCTPLVSVFGQLPDDLSATDRVAMVRNFNQIELAVDDEPMKYPALVEFEGDEIHSFFDAALGRRMTLRILIELGSRLQIKFGDGSQETLSLLGSRRVLETAVARCKKHS